MKVRKKSMRSKDNVARDYEQRVNAHKKYEFDQEQLKQRYEREKKIIEEVLSNAQSF